MTGTWAPWRAATQDALYGDGGFYRRPAGPAAHFRTSVHASPLFAQALLRLAQGSGLTTVVDVGSGRGELLAVLHGLDPSLTLVGVEVADRPASLPEAIGWGPRVPDDLTDALLVANEWLDNVPVDVVVRTPGGLRLLEVDRATGQERPGGLPSAYVIWPRVSRRSVSISMPPSEPSWPRRVLSDRPSIRRTS